MNRQSWWIAWSWSLAVHAALLSLMAWAILDRRVPVRGGVGLVVEMSLAGEDQSGRGRFDDGDWDTAAKIDFTLDIAGLGQQNPAAAPSVVPASFVDRGPRAEATKVVPAVAVEPVPSEAPTARPAPRGRPVAHRTRTAIFGVPGEGAKFVYVFDRSASTGGPPHNTLAAAKAQLIASLEGLGPVHQFQIIFYNQVPTLFVPGRQSWGLCFATPQNKLLARRFIGSITPDGSTNHQQALRLAIGLRPDVIFFLTDGDEPRLSAGELDAIRRMAGTISINAIEFGVGPQSAADDFMVQLARQNGGLFGYVDVTRLGPVEVQ